MGQLGYSSEEFWSLTPREFWNALEGNYEHYQNLQREDWVRDRYFTTVLLNAQLSKGAQIDPKDLITFEWEQDRVIVPPNDDDLQRILERDKKLLKNG